MPTENLQSQHHAGSDFVSDAWEVLPGFPGRGLRQGSIQVVWSGLDALDGVIEIEVSNDGINWNCYGTNTEVTLTPAAQNQVYEFQKFMTRFVRVKYTRNSVNAGSISIWTRGAPW